MRNIRTPRTLSECSFHVGYPAVEHAAHVPLGERIYGVLLAVVIGIVMAALLAHWAAQ